MTIAGHLTTSTGAVMAVIDLVGKDGLFSPNLDGVTLGLLLLTQAAPPYP